MSTAGNFLWIIFGGFISALMWCFAGILMAITIIGLPWARACFTLANFALFPFGREAVNRQDLKGSDVGTGKAGTLGNIIWFILAGWWMALGHLLMGIGLCISLIGIPFGIQHFKLAGISLAPVGKMIVNKHLAKELATDKAKSQLADYKSQKN